MKRPNLKAMSFDELIELRDSADRIIQQRATLERRTLEEKLARLSGFVGRMLPGGGRGASLKGRKVEPKFRNPNNEAETWAGRGARPRWLQALIQEGGKLENYAIAASGGAKRGPRKGAKKAAVKK